MQTKEELIYFFDTEFKLLLQNISADTKPLWGTMNAQRMIEHLAMGFKIANGKIIIPLSAIDGKAGKLKAIFLLSDRPLPKDFQNPILPKGLMPLEHLSLTIAKQKLLEEADSFFSFFNLNPNDETFIHNLFGNLNYHEWLWFEYKHFMHHFMQFGIVKLEEKII
jgi:oxepin-CoA hydrolase / 3-oxo-5,6-dehydrosuberyl-CoA semialdehyde dehydrogenase